MGKPVEEADWEDWPLSHYLCNPPQFDWGETRWHTHLHQISKSNFTFTKDRTFHVRILKMCVLQGWVFFLKEMVHLYLRFMLVVGLLLICCSVTHKVSTVVRLHPISKSVSGFRNETFLRHRLLTHRLTPTRRAKFWNSSCLTPKLCPARLNPPWTEAPIGTHSRTQTSPPR